MIICRKNRAAWKGLWLFVVLAGLILPAAAATVLEEAVRIKPRHFDAHNLLGTALGVLGNSMESIEEFRLAAAALPENAQVHNDFGELLLRQGRAAEAL